MLQLTSECHTTTKYIIPDNHPTYPQMITIEEEIIKLIRRHRPQPLLPTPDNNLQLL